VAGDVIPHDREFLTVMGVDVATLRMVLGLWPAGSEKWADA
jgi:hypothetical protein